MPLCVQTNELNLGRVALPLDSIEEVYLIINKKRDKKFDVSTEVMNLLSDGIITHSFYSIQGRQSNPFLCDLL